MNDKMNMVIILAAGKGTRMNSDIPKVLHTLNNKTLLEHVIDAAKSLKPQQIIVVVGYKKNLVIEKFKSEDLIFVEQKTQQGTADAIKYCLPQTKNFNGNVLILSGDVPLIKPETLKEFIKTHDSYNAHASLISAKIDDPTGYGRIIKNNNNQLIKIVEHKDASDKQKEIKEINSGIYIVDSQTLNQTIPLIDNKNAQSEYYLTDIFNFIDEKDTSIFEVKNNNEISGINTIVQLSNMEKKY